MSGRKRLVFIVVGLSALSAPADAWAAPANDNFGSAQAISGATGRVTGSNLNATTQFAEPSHAGNTGGASVWYVWTAPAGAGRVAFTTNGSDFRTVIAVYTGNAINSLSWVDGSPYSPSKAEFDAVDGQTYRIAVDGQSDGDGSNLSTGNLVLNWGPPPPSNDQGAGQVLRGADAAVIGTNAGATKDYVEPNHAGNAGGHSIGYSWEAPQSGTVTIDTLGSSFNTLLDVYRGTGWYDPVAANDDISGSNNRSRVTFSASQGQIYGIWIDGKNGATGTVHLNIELAVPHPANDAFANAQTITGASGSVEGDTTGAGTEAGEPYHGGFAGYGGSSIWYSWTAPATGPTVFSTSDVSFSSMLGVYTGGSVSTLTVVKNGYASGLDDTAHVSFNAVEGTEYKIAVDGGYSGYGPVTLNWLNEPPIPNDDFADATLLSGPDGSFSGSNLGATKEPGEPDHAGNAGGSSAWFKWTPSSSGRVTFDTSGSLFDTLLAVYTGPSVESLTPLVWSDDQGSFDISSNVQFNAQAGVTYRIAVDGYDGAQERLELAWNAVRPPNDDLRDTEGLFGLTDLWDGDNFFATKEPDEANHAGNSGGHSVWFGWLAPGTGTVTIDLSGSDFDTVLAAYGSADSMADLVEIDSDDDSGEGSTSKITLEVNHGDWLNIVVDGKNGAEGHIHLSLSEVVPPPPNDDFADAQVVSGATGSVPGTNLGATEETGEPNHVSLSGSSVWYRWTAPATGTVTFRSNSSDSTLLLLAVYRGASVNALTLVARPGYSASNFERRATFSAVSGTTYRIAVAGTQLSDAPAFGTFAFSWNQVTPPPANDFFADATTLSGVSGTVTGNSAKAGKEEGEPGNPVNLCIGEATVWYRWTAPGNGVAQFDTNNSSFDTTLAVYTGSSLGALNRVTYDDDSGESWWSRVAFQATDGTTYFIQLDKCGFEGGDYELHVNPDLPGNDAFANGETLTGFSGATFGTNMWATKEPGEPDHAGNEGGASTWFTWTAPADGMATFDTAESSIDTLLAVYTGSNVDGLVEVESNDNADSTYQSEVSFLAQGGTTYRIAVDGFNDPQLDGVDMGSYALHWAVRPVNDDFSTRSALENNSIIGDTTGATAELDEPAHAGVGAGASVWFSWTAPANGTVTFDTTGSEIDTRLAVYTGSNIHDLDEVASDDDSGGHGTSRLSFQALEDATYAIVVDGPEGPFHLHWETPPVGIPFTTLRAGTVSSPGAPVHVAWSASEPADSYEVERKNGAGDWTPLASPTGTQTNFMLAPGETQVQVRAIQSGSPSGWATSEAFALVANQESAGAVAYKGHWALGRTSSAYGGKLKYSSDRGATAKISFTGEIGIVAARGPARGKAAVVVDGVKVATLDLYSSRSRSKVLVYRWKAGDADQHVLTYRVLGTKNVRSTGKRVDLDALLILG